MTDNPILDEIHRIRAELSDRLGGDIQAIGQHLRELQAKRGGPTVTRPPKPARTLILGGKRPASDRLGDASTNRSTAQ
jgi:hypothetical protein